MKNIANEKALLIKVDDSCALTQEWGVRVVPHLYMEIVDGLVQNKSQPIGKHMISGTCIRDNQPESITNVLHH
jgi:hypothetical protein